MNADLDSKVITRAKNTAYRFLAQRPRSRAEIVRKLCDKEFDEAIIEAVLDELARLGYVNDRRFASQWSLCRIRLRGFGRRRIEQELKVKGIDKVIINETFADIYGIGTELETATQVAEKKLNTMKALDREVRRRRLCGFLERKGFAYDVIGAVLRETCKI
jgi:regulatory protein